MSEAFEQDHMPEGPNPSTVPKILYTCFDCWQWGDPPTCYRREELRQSRDGNSRCETCYSEFHDTYRGPGLTFDEAPLPPEYVPLVKIEGIAPAGRVFWSEYQKALESIEEPEQEPLCEYDASKLPTPWK